MLCFAFGATEGDGRAARGEVGDLTRAKWGQGMLHTCTEQETVKNIVYCKSIRYRCRCYRLAAGQAITRLQRHAVIFHAAKMYAAIPAQNAYVHKQALSDHFRLDMTLEHMSIKPTFALLSGKDAMARAALST